ncbi:peroxide stress protein YaaA [Thermophilibacter sp.]
MRLTLMVSPAKKMRELDAEPRPRRLPELVGRAERLAEALRSLSRDEAQALWRCSDRLADLNYERLRTLDPRRADTAAVCAYDGIQYTHLAAPVMTERQLSWLDDHLRILSGLYGVLRPLDAVVPYRLEMQARLAVDGARDLYEFWGAEPYERIAATCDLIVNVASVEYARAVTPHVRADGPQVLTCLFGTIRDGRLRQASTEAKAARGTFARWCAEREVSDAAELRAFAERGYALDEGRSDDATLVFVRP